MWLPSLPPLYSLHYVFGPTGAQPKTRVPALCSCLAWGAPEIEAGAGPPRVSLAFSCPVRIRFMWTNSSKLTWRKMQRTQPEPKGGLLLVLPRPEPKPRLVAASPPRPQPESGLLVLPRPEPEAAGLFLVLPCPLTLLALPRPGGRSNRKYVLA